jgi:hypothetical protein
VARADSPKGILSMSTYGKPQPPQLQGKQFEARSLFFDVLISLQVTNEHIPNIRTRSQVQFTGPRRQSHQQPQLQSTKMLLS